MQGVSGAKATIKVLKIVGAIILIANPSVLTYRSIAPWSNFLDLSIVSQIANRFPLLHRSVGAITPER